MNPSSDAVKTNCRDIDNAVRRFYETFPFPGNRVPDLDGLILMRRLCKQIGKTSQPRADGSVGVLDAGCGTGNTIVSLARMFPTAAFQGVDLSEPSLIHARELASAAHLDNLRLRRWNLMVPLADGSLFDIILCLGVLHHTADMCRVLRNLGTLLKPNGLLYLWVYGRHGRYRHTLNRRLLDMLINAGDAADDPVELAKTFALHSCDGGIMNDLLGHSAAEPRQRKTFESRVWIADQFLHPVEALLDMEALLTLIDNAGLEMDAWLGLPKDPQRLFHSAALAERFSRLSQVQQLIGLDLLLKPERYFVVLRGRPDR